MSMLQLYRKAQSAGAAPAAAAASSSSGRGVTAVAVLDDFTIVGQPAAALAAMDCFMAECERIGLAVNRAKYVVLCPERHALLSLPALRSRLLYLLARALLYSTTNN